MCLTMELKKSGIFVQIQPQLPLIWYIYHNIAIMALGSLSDKFAWRVQAIRLGCRMVDRRPGNTAPVKYQLDRITLITYLPLWDFARPGGKTSYRGYPAKRALLAGYHRYGFVKISHGYISISFSVTALTRRGASTRTNSDSYICATRPTRIRLFRAVLLMWVSYCPAIYFVNTIMKW